MKPSVFPGRVASLAVIASLVLAVASIAAEPRATLPSAPAADRNLSRRRGFEANCGQVDEHVQFVARGPAYTAFLTSTEAVLTLGDRHGGHAVLRMERIGANAGARAAGSGLLPGVVSYFPDGRVDSPVSAPAYRRVRYDDVYPGIDLVYYSRARSLEYDFVVAPRVDPNQIALRIDGAERVEVDGEGTLVVHTAAGDIRQPRPVAYQRIGGIRRLVAADYALDAEGQVRLRLGEYDRSRRLVIDPVITYATYLGGTGDEARINFDGEVRLARDAAGNLYVTGTTRSTDFPTTAGVASRTLGGSADVFVTKFSPGGAVLYSTYLGGPCEDYGRAIAVDGAGNAYVTGEVNGGGTCVSTPGVLVAKLDPNGSLVYASRLGGSLLDSSYGTGIAVDAAGHAYVTGVAITSDFPTTVGAYRTAACPNVYPFAGDGFVAKLTVDGSALVYSTLLCGQGDDSPAGIAIDAAGNAYLAGTTASSDFPLVDPIELARGGGVMGLSGFVSKLSPDGSQLLYSTYLGGSGSAVINAIALDAAGNAYVTGAAGSTDFPTTPGVIQEKAGRRHCIDGCYDAFVTKIAPSGSALVYSTYLYGELDDAGNAIAVDGAGNAYVVGQTNSLLFPILDAFQSSKRHLDDAFVVKLNPDATRLVYSSYLGGSKFDRSPGNGYDTGTAIVLDAAGNAYVAGYTQSKDLPTTPDAFQPNLAFGTCDVQDTACGDGFVAKISAGGPGVTPAVNLTVDTNAVAAGGTLTATWAGNPTPTASDYLRLFTLGSEDAEFDDPVIYWPTPNAAAGQLQLLVPAVAAGWYELRLLSPDPGSGLAVPIARSQPIRIDGSVPPPPPPPPPPPSGASCDVGGASACDDGDPCTEDACVPGVGCVSTPVSGFASVTCTCGRSIPEACAGQVLPASIGGRRQRVCDLFASAAATTRRPLVLRRLRRAVQTLNGSIRLVGSRRKTVAAACVGALKGELRDTRDRSRRLLARPAES
jgi:Beta-propeller repeat